MWLLTSRSPLLTHRASPVGVGWIDAFFDRWLPTFVDEIRRLNKGAVEAARRHRSVTSVDGVSRPLARGNTGLGRHGVVVEGEVDNAAEELAHAAAVESKAARQSSLAAREEP